MMLLRSVILWYLMFMFQALEPGYRVSWFKIEVLQFFSTENILLMNKLMEQFVEHYLLVSLSDVVKEG